MSIKRRWRFGEKPHWLLTEERWWRRRLLRFS